MVVTGRKLNAFTNSHVLLKRHYSEVSGGTNILNRTVNREFENMMNLSVKE